MESPYHSGADYPDPKGVAARVARRKKSAASAARRRKKIVRRRRRQFRSREFWILVLLVWGYFAGAPTWRLLVSDPDWVFDADAQGSLVDRKGSLYMTWPEYGDRRPVPYDELSEHLVNAVIAREDQRFRRHPGVDPLGIARAAVADIQARSLTQGGSTITMQLVEVVYRYPQDSTVQKLRAKIFELMMAPRLEWYAARKAGSRDDGKKALLAAYLSRIEYGNRTLGIREAANCYFGKPAAKLTLGESAYLAGLIRGPSVNNVYRNPEKARDARDAVVLRMKRRGMITKEEADGATFYVRDAPVPKKRRGDGFTSAAVRRELDQLVAEGELPVDYLGGDPVKIHLSFDFRIHDLAARSLLKQITRIEATRGFRGSAGQLQGAVVVIDNQSGAILTSVGGRNFDRLSYDCALQGRRTVASAGKPFIYASYMETRGHRADSLLSNAGLTVSEASDYKGFRFPHETELLDEGEHPLWMGLAYSSNRMTLRAGAETGMMPWQKLLQDTALIDEPLVSETSMWLGSFAVRPVDLAAAYSVFPRGGKFIAPYLVERVEIGGRKFYQRRSKSRRVISSETSGEVTAALREVLTVGTAAYHGGRELAKRKDVAGKTGTSDGVFDAWFVGYGSDVTVAVWLGFPEGNRTILEGGTGGRLAFPVWKSIIEGLPKEYRFDPIPLLGAGRRTLTMAE